MAVLHLRSGRQMPMDVNGALLVFLPAGSKERDIESVARSVEDTRSLALRSTARRAIRQAATAHMNW